MAIIDNKDENLNCKRCNTDFIEAVNNMDFITRAKSIRRKTLIRSALRGC